MKYFLHRIQKANGTFSKGIEIHDTLDSARVSFWGRMKLGYGKSENTFVSCKIIDENGSVVKPYDMAWLKPGEETENKFFLHHVRKDGETTSKDIDVLDSLDTAYGDFAAQMEYGYNNTQHPNVTLVSCQITDMMSGGMVLLEETWNKPETEPEE